MKNLILLLLLIHSLSAKAQDDYSFNALYRSFEEGSTQYILTPKAPIFVAPSAAADTVNKLAIGSPVRILERMDELEKRQGFRTNWYHIEYILEGKRTDGFIWGGHIAVGHSQSQIDSTIRFLYGVSQIKMIDRGDYQDPSLFIQISACRNGLPLAKIEIAAAGTIYTKTQLLALGSRGLEGVTDVLELGYNDGYCGGVSATTVLFWANNKLYFIRLLSNGFSDQYFSNQSFVYPKEKDGLAGCVIYRKESGSLESGQVKTSQTEDKVYTWDGQRLLVGNKKN